MKHFGNQLDELLKKKKIKQKDFAGQIGISVVTMTKWKSLNSIDAAKLENISRMLNVPITYWFDEIQSSQTIVTGNGNAATVFGNATVGQLADRDKEIEHLKLLLKEKERTIQILMSK